MCTARPTTPGSARSTATAWRCCGRGSAGAPKMPNQLSKMVEERIVAFALGASGPGAQARRLRARRARSGAGSSSRPTGSGRCSAATASTPAPSAWGWSPATPRPMSRRAIPAPSSTSTSTRPGELVGIDCFYVGRLRGHRGRDLAADRDRHLPPPSPGPSWWSASRADPHRPPDLKLARRVAARPPRRRLATRARALRQRQRVQGRLHRTTDAPEGPPHPHPRRAPADQRQRRSAPQDDPRRVLAPRLRALPLPRATAAYAASSTPTSTYYNHDRVHHGRLTRGQIPTDIIYGARKMEAR